MAEWDMNASTKPAKMSSVMVPQHQHGRVARSAYHGVAAAAGSRRQYGPSQAKSRASGDEDRRQLRYPVR
jgi:hypothetical protein